MFFWTKKRQEKLEADLEEVISARFHNAFKAMLDQLVKDMANIHSLASGGTKKLDGYKMAANARLSKLEYLFREEIAEKEKERSATIKAAQAKERGNNG